MNENPRKECFEMKKQGKVTAEILSNLESNDR